jgi:LPXTG-motif cell wall-anchored protein
MKKATDYVGAIVFMAIAAALAALFFLLFRRKEEA